MKLVSTHSTRDWVAVIYSIREVPGSLWEWSMGVGGMRLEPDCFKKQNLSLMTGISFAPSLRARFSFLLFTDTVDVYSHCLDSTGDCILKQMRRNNSSPRQRIPSSPFAEAIPVQHQAGHSYCKRL